MGQSSDPSRPVGSRRAISPTGLDRQVARLYHIGAHLMYGPPREPTASPGALWGGTIGPRLIGAPRFGRPTTPTGAAAATGTVIFFIETPLEA